MTISTVLPRKHMPTKYRYSSSQARKKKGGGNLKCFSPAQGPCYSYSRASFISSNGGGLTTPSVCLCITFSYTSPQPAGNRGKKTRMKG